MIKSMQNISTIKQDIQDKRLKQVSVRFSPGRNKVICYTGTLTGVYPQIFTVSPDDKTYYGKTTYAYTDVLSGAVKITELK